MAVLLRLVRYGFVGIATNAVGYLVYLLITWLGMGPKTAMTLLYGIGATLGYFGHRRISFGFDGGYRSSGVRYALAYAGGYALNFAMLRVFVDEGQHPHQIVQLVAIVATAAYLFVCLNAFVFPRSDGLRPLRSDPNRRDRALKSTVPTARTRWRRQG